MKVCKVYFFSKERLQVSLNNSVTKYVELIFNEVPRLMGRKFKFSQLAGNWRKRELAPALDLLLKASVVHDVRHTSASGIADRYL